MLIKRIRELREKSEMTQTEFAKTVGIPVNKYIHYESDARKMPSDLLVILANFHGVSIEYLLDFTDDPTPYRPRE